MRSLFYKQLVSYSGFLFYTYKDGLSASNPLTPNEMNKIPIRKYNHDDVPLIVKCTKCGKYMDFKPGPKEDGDGHWSCSKCKREIPETTAYDILKQENIENLHELGLL